MGRSLYPYTGVATIVVGIAFLAKHAWGWAAFALIGGCVLLTMRRRNR